MLKRDYYKRESCQSGCVRKKKKIGIYSDCVCKEFERSVIALKKKLALPLTFGGGFHHSDGERETKYGRQLESQVILHYAHARRSCVEWRRCKGAEGVAPPGRPLASYFFILFGLKCVPRVSGFEKLLPDTAALNRVEDFGGFEDSNFCVFNIHRHARFIR